MAYGHGEWEFELFDRTRRLLRDAVMINKADDAAVKEAREICDSLTYLCDSAWYVSPLGEFKFDE
jgi:hypothetical protein